MRDDFPEDIKRALAQRVANRCSHPECGAPTSGPQTDESKAVNVGVAAHITAASVGGPRYDASFSPAERGHASNGIWLCQTHAKLIDNDVARYTPAVLRDWKASAEAAADALVGKTAKPPAMTGLRIELPAPVNRVGYQSSGYFVSEWSVKVRLIAEGKPLDVVEVEVSETGVGPWRITEVFREGSGERVTFPISVERSTEFWIRATSPRTFDTKPTSVGPMTLRFRDHTQSEGESHELIIKAPQV